MPALNTQLMLATARARFSSFQLRLPTAAGSRAPQLSILSAAIRSRTVPQTTFSRQRPMRGTPLPCPPALFLAASDDTRDVENQGVCSGAMDTYLTRICNAIGQAHNSWRMQAKLIGVLVNAVQACAGSLQGIVLGPEILVRGPQEDQWQRPRTQAIAAGIGFCWENWRQSVSVPGLPWYPSFAACPAPVAPPTPNVPAPLLALVQNAALLSTVYMKTQMAGHYNGDNEWSNELFEAVAFGFERAFQAWAPAQMIVNVMATGPVPTFAPPYVPAGPVVGGLATQAPGAWLV